MIVIIKDETDMPKIKETYKRIYCEDMVKKIKSDNSRYYQKIMIELCFN